MDQASETRSLRDYLRAIKARRILVIATTLAAVAAAVVLSVIRSPTYSSTAKVSVESDFNTQNANAVPGAAALEGQVVMTRPDVLAAASKALGGSPTPDQLRSDVSATAEIGVNVVDVAAEAGSADQAARVANAVANAADRVTHDEAARNFTLAAENAPNPAQARSFRAQAATARPMRIASVGQPPASATSPKPARDIVFAGLLGLVLGCGLALLRDAFDRKVSSAHAVQASLGIPLLGYVGKDLLGMSQFPVNGAGVSDEDLESFRILRTNTEFLGDGHALTAVAVTSALPEEGKSTVASWYAYINALAGRRTILIEADLRRPVLAARLEVDESPGLSDFLLGHADPGEVLRSIPIEGPTAEPLAVIPAGPAPAQASELVSSPKFGEFLGEVAEAYDLVVLDCPPLLPVGDTLSIVPKVDGVMLCVRVGQTTEDQAVAAKNALRRLPTKPSGLVVTGVKPGGPDDYVGYYTSSLEESSEAGGPAA
jgi:capsular exopolysaccharide synthesis family protein